MDASEIHVVFSMNLDTYAQSPWLGSWDSLDHFNDTFEVLSLDETPWNDLHHHSSFLPSLSAIPSCL